MNLFRTFYNLTTIDKEGGKKNYYFGTCKTIRNPKQAIKAGFAPDNIRLEIEENEETVYSIGFISPWKYFLNFLSKVIDKLRGE